MFEKIIPLSLYIHLPWCIKKCPYCDFNSHQLQPQANANTFDFYIEALIADLTQSLPIIAGRSIQSIFFGGGTPSLFPAASIGKLLIQINNLTLLEDKAEITLEVNPGTLEHGNLRDYIDAGINRLSIGAQSFQDDKLQALGRIHSKQDITLALTKLKAMNFNNFNIDLMFGLPQQSVADALADLQQALQLQPAHISWYQLTLEPNTAFYHTSPQLPDEEQCWQIQQEGMQLLAANQFQQYEVSAFAQTAEQQSKHNLNYWTFGDYLGVGAGAHSKITDIPSGIIQRHSKIKHPRAYLAKYQSGLNDHGGPNISNNPYALQQQHPQPTFIATQEILVPQQIPFEFMLNALRLTEGFKKSLFTARTGLPLTTINATLDKAVELGLLVSGQHNITPTQFGKRFLNEIMQLFLTTSKKLSMESK